MSTTGPALLAKSCLVTGHKLLQSLTGSSKARAWESTASVMLGSEVVSSATQGCEALTGQELQGDAARGQQPPFDMHTLTQILPGHCRKHSGHPLKVRESPTQHLTDTQHA
jgi:hypothetical protein